MVNGDIEDELNSFSNFQKKPTLWDFKISSGDLFFSSLKISTLKAVSKFLLFVLSLSKISKEGTFDDKYSRNHGNRGSVGVGPEKNNEPLCPSRPFFEI